MKNLFILLMMMGTLFLCSHELKAQSLNWVPLSTIVVDSSSNVLVFYAESCMDSTAILMKFINTGSTPVHLNWSLFSLTPFNEIDLGPFEQRESLCSGFEILKEFVPNGMTAANINLVYTIQ